MIMENVNARMDMLEPNVIVVDTATFVGTVVSKKSPFLRYFNLHPPILDQPDWSKTGPCSESCGGFTY